MIIGAEKTITLSGGTPMTFCWCPATTSDDWMAISGGRDYFMMGSPNSEFARGSERLHPVKLTCGFWMGKYEVTWQQWTRVMKGNPSHCAECSHNTWCSHHDNLPVSCVSWDDCMEFIQRANVHSEEGIAFPTEAQWEYACRAGTETPFSFGSVLNGHKANCSGHFPYGTYTIGPNPDKPMPVGSYGPNPWGLYDMHGNVWEWCADWFINNDYAGLPYENPVEVAESSLRVMRGGCYGLSADHCRSARRDGYPPSNFHESIGFRLCCAEKEI